MNSEVINTMPLYLNEPKRALDFLVEKLGFMLNECPPSKKTGGVIVCDSYGNFYEIFSIARKNTDGKKVPEPVINTTDCLQAFYTIEPKGLQILNKPHYVPEGLTFEILDYWNNKYTFLEKRDYND
jgi:hypothetical protein